MPRDLPIGNGKVLVAFDSDYGLRELSYPHVGRENHVHGALCRFGAFVDGTFTWIERAQGWDLVMRYQPDTLVTDVQCQHAGMGLLLSWIAGPATAPWRPMRSTWLAFSRRRCVSTSSAPID